MAVVTGGASGIGREVARELGRRGASVFILDCDANGGRRAAEECSGEFIGADFRELGSVERAASAFLARSDHLHLLYVVSPPWLAPVTMGPRVNCAGIMAVPHAITPDAHESQLQGPRPCCPRKALMEFVVNYLAGHLLTRLLTPALVKSAPSRVVFTASVVHYLHRGGLDLGAFAEPLHPFAAYYRSKYCVMLDAQSFSRCLEQYGVMVNSVHPGTVATRLFSHLDATYGWALAGLVRGVASAVLASPERGARVVLYPALACAASSTTGTYFFPYEACTTPVFPDGEASALWDWAQDATRKYTHLH